MLIFNDLKYNNMLNFTRQLKYRIWPVAALLLLSVMTAVSQNITVSGTVTDSKDGSSIPGVSILIKGTTIGTITDIDGKYTLEAEPTAILVYSFVGYQVIEIKVAGRTKIDVVMEEEAKKLDEVIVIGYGTQRKTDKTGAVAMVTSAELNKGVMQDAIQSLVGKTPGVLITKKGGDPNSGFSVKIRSQASLFTSTEPLYVVDGVPGVDPTTIAPEDIESFNVLKDASSSAIYGASGANGVVIITTKKGKAGKVGSNVEFSSTLSFDKVARRMDLLTASDMRAFIQEFNYDASYDGGANTDWQDEVYRTGVTQSYNTSITGGNEFSNFRASLNHTVNEGVLKGSSKERTNGRLNYRNQLFDNRLIINAVASGTVEKNKYIKYSGWGNQDIIFQMLQRNPTDPVYDSLGNYHQSRREFNYSNPLAVIDELQNERSAKRFMGNISSDWEIVKGFKHWLSISYARDDDESWYFEPAGGWSAPEGYGSRTFNNKEVKTLESTFTFNKEVMAGQNLNVIAGYSYQEELYTGISAHGSGPTSNLLRAYNLTTLNLVKQGDISAYYNTVNRIGIFGRINYNIDSKYILTATLRHDGSSKFGKNNRWGSFPSASVAWDIKKESFMDNIVPVEQLKLRIGYGVAGNDKLSSNHAYMPEIGPNGTTFDFESGEYVPRYTATYSANPDLKWEENRELNIGLDFGLLNNKISGSLEVYRRTTNNLIVDVDVQGNPAYAFDRLWINGGKFKSSGFEAYVQYFALNLPMMDWKTQFSFSSFNQEIVSLNESWKEDNNKKGWITGRGLVGGENWSQYIQEGWELGTFYMPEYAGLSSDGKYLFHTAAGGVTREIDKAERRVLGHALPAFEMGWSNYFTLYKNIDFSFAFRAVYGADVLNATRLYFGNPNVLPNLNALQEAVSEKRRGVTSMPVINNMYLEDGSFIRLENISLGYTFDKFPAHTFEKLRVAVTANNLFLITKYKGADPEMTYSGLDFGIDNYNVYPKTRSIMFGLTLTL